MAAVKRDRDEEVVCVNEDALDALVLKRAKVHLIFGDWAMRKKEGGDGFEEAELERLKQNLEDTKKAFYYALLSLGVAEYFVANPPHPVE